MVVTVPAEEMSIRQALAAVGIADRPDAQVIVATITERLTDGGTIISDTQHHYLDKIGNISPDGVSGNLYATTGLFRLNCLVNNKGRTRDNLERIVCLPFDCDLTDFYEIDPKRKREFYETRQSEIDEMIEEQLEAVTDCFEQAGVPIHRIDYTGHGLAVYAYVADQDQCRIDDLLAMHERNVERINEIAGVQLVDTASKDAGTRVMRIPHSYNQKGSTPRLVKTLKYKPNQYITVTASEAKRKTQAPVDAPADGKGLSPVAIEHIFDAIAPFYVSGVKHRMTNAIAGMFGKALVPQSQAAAFIDRLSAGDNNPRAKARNVKTTYDNLRAGRPVSGFHTLKELVSPAKLEFVDDTLRDFYRSTQTSPTLPSIVVGSQPKQPAGEIREFPFSIQSIPDAARRGWVGEYINLVEPTSEAPESFHIACAMTLIGALVARRVHVYHRSDELFPNIYLLLDGPSGSGKDTAIKRMLRMPQIPTGPGSGVDNPPTFKVVWDFASAESMISRLAESKRLLLYQSEFAKLMGNANREGTSTLKPVIMNAFDNPIALQNNTKSDAVEARDFTICIASCVQPEVLSELVTGTDQFSGFLNRFWIVPGEANGPRPNPPHLDEQLASDLYADIVRTIAAYGDKKRLLKSPEADALWNDWYNDDYYTTFASPAERAMHARTGMYLLKFSLIYAIADGAREIGADHFLAGKALSDWSWNHTRQIVPMLGEAPDAKLQRKISDYLKRKGASKRVQVQRGIGHSLGPGVFQRVVDAMVKNGELYEDSDKVLSLAEG